MCITILGGINNPFYFCLTHPKQWSCTLEKCSRKWSHTPKQVSRTLEYWLRNPEKWLHKWAHTPWKWLCNPKQGLRNPPTVASHPKKNALTSPKSGRANDRAPTCTDARLWGCGDVGTWSMSLLASVVEDSSALDTRHSLNALASPTQ